ncbi:MAG: PspC domain-containing protein [Candidatus Odinarchaeota archaeon]
MKHCQNCGTTIKNLNDRFCPECGAKLDSLGVYGQRRLYRSTHNKMIAGVCSGLGKHLNVDPTIIRIVFIVATFFYGVGLFAYLLFWILTPVEPVNP